MPAKLDRCVTSVSSSKEMLSRYPDANERKSRAFAICNASLKKKGGSMDYGFLVRLDEQDIDLSRVNALAIGKYKHPVYGEIEITKERLEQFAANVNGNVRGVDLDIDYDHKDKDGRAAGWVKTAEVDDEGRLWFNVDWTPDAKESISKKEYRYFSPEFMDEWEDSEGAIHSDVLFGGALTNRPFMKDLVPLNFSEYVTSDKILDLGDEGIYKFDSKTSEWRKLRENKPTPKDDGKEGNLDPKKLAEILGIEGDEAALIEAVTDLKTFKESATKDEEKAKKFAEDYPEIAKKMAEDAQRLTELESGNKLMEADAKVKVWSEGDHALPAKVGDKVRDFRQTLTSDQTEKFDDLMGDINTDGLVKINGESGENGDPTDDDKVKEFTDLINSIYDANKDKQGFNYFDAVKLAEVESPDAAKLYKMVNR